MLSPDHQIKRIKLLESILLEHGIDPDVEIAKRESKTLQQDKIKLDNGRFDPNSVSPFVEEYAPYTKGMGVSEMEDPVKHASRMWNMYYRHNTTQGFKDRHYLTREVPEIKESKLMMECGCGVGNAMYPLLEEFSQLKFIACDLSDVAVRLLKNKEAYDKDRILAFQHDLSLERLPDNVPANVDIATLIFVLSAVQPEQHSAVAKHIAEKISVGGLLYFRDYAHADLAQSRLGDSSLVPGYDNFYMRTCGTCSYFFKESEMTKIFSPYFEVVECSIIEREVENKKNDIVMHRKWIQAKLKRV